MKIIFLDIDGVLNHELFFKERSMTDRKNDLSPKENYYLSMIDENKVGLLNTLIENTSAKVVISSSWRKAHSLNDMRDLLKTKGLKGEIIDVTPVLQFKDIPNVKYRTSVPRGCEINAWLELNKNLFDDNMSEASHVIFDDDSDMLYRQRENYFRVDSHCGLTPNIVYRATLFLNR